MSFTSDLDSREKRALAYLIEVLQEDFRLLYFFNLFNCLFLFTSHQIYQEVFWRSLILSHRFYYQASLTLLRIVFLLWNLLDCHQRIGLGFINQLFILTLEIRHHRRFLSRHDVPQLLLEFIFQRLIKTLLHLLNLILLFDICVSQSNFSYLLLCKYSCNFDGLFRRMHISQSLT